MAETTQFVSKISVKDLISAFENKSETVKVEFSRPRARSFGNVLNKNVIVRLSEFTTLEEIEEGLTKSETDLNFYEVYNKAKHVAFQEQFFNILTSIANIENNDDDAPLRKKRLISRTQTLVSFLNQKLPTNINQVVEPKQNQYKYIPYASQVKTNAKVEGDSSNEVKLTNSNVQPKLYVESGSNIDVIDSGKDYIVSVKKLKENFQNRTQSDDPPKQERTKVAENKKIQPETKQIESPPPPLEIKSTTTTFLEKIEPVSVMKLRSLFEERSSSKGLEVITVDKPQLSKNDFGGSMQNINNNIPYTERNLGTIRLQRSVSGNYMNYSGLLKRVDINRSSSFLEVSKRNVVEDSSDEESVDENDDVFEDDKPSVGIGRISSAIAANRQSIENNLEQEHVHINKDSEHVQVKYSSNMDSEENNNETEGKIQNGSVLENDRENGLDVVKENVSNLQGYDEEEVNYSKADIEDVHEDETYESIEHLTFKGVNEVEVNSATADYENVHEEQNVATLEIAEDQSQSTENSKETDNIRATENELSFKGYDEEEVNQATAVSKNVQNEENVATLEATTQYVSQSISTLENSNQTDNTRTTENDLSFKGYDEEEVKQATAFSRNLQIEENVAKLEAITEDVSQKSILTSEVEIKNLSEEQQVDSANKTEWNESHITEGNQYVDNSREDSSIFSSLHELEDERERSLIEEVIDQIDIEQTLANADLVVNPEDLKNADDEFEKLLESSNVGK